MINNVTFMPVAVYFMVGTLTTFGDELDAEASSSLEGTLEGPIASITCRGAGPRSRMLLKFAEMLGNLFLGLTLVQLVGWAPTFIVDYILVKYGQWSS